MISLADWSRRARIFATIGAACIALAACSSNEEAQREQIARDILATPGAQELWQAIKTEYPQDFDALVSQIHALDPVQRNETERVEQIGAAWLQDFFETITLDAIKAPAPAMLAFSEAERELYVTLQGSAVEECGALTMGEWISFDENNAIASRAVAQRNTAIVRAAAAGRDDPQDYGEPDEADFDQLGDAIAATGIDPELHAKLGSQDQMLALNREQQCDLGTAFYTGITNLPDDVEPQMAAYMFAPE